MPWIAILRKMLSMISSHAKTLRIAEGKRQRLFGIDEENRQQTDDEPSPVVDLRPAVLASIRSYQWQYSIRFYVY